MAHETDTTQRRPTRPTLKYLTQDLHIYDELIEDTVYRFYMLYKVEYSSECSKREKKLSKHMIPRDAFGTNLAGTDTAIAFRFFYWGGGGAFHSPDPPPQKKKELAF